MAAVSFQYTPFPEDPTEMVWHRVLCVAPAAVSWLVLLLLFVSSIAVPAVGAAVIIAFLVFYIFRVAHNALFLVISFLRVFAEERSDWLKRLEELSGVSLGADQGLVPSIRTTRYGERLHAEVLASCRSRSEPVPDPRQLTHLVIIPVANERRAVFEAGIRALSEGILDPKRSLVVVLSVEARSSAEVRAEVEDVRAAYARYFRDFVVAVHPSDLAGEVPGKGSNVGYTARVMADYFRQRSVSFDMVLLTCVDADALLNPSYFACLSYYFLAEPDRHRSCFQPLPVFSNNIWKTNALVRVLEMSQTIFQLVDSANVDMLVTFSCYSYSFQALYESGFWPADVIGEDAGVFWKTFMHFKGAFKAIPLPVTVTMDAPEGRTFWKTLRTAYRQKVRWAYGVENMAIVFRGLLRHRVVRGRRAWQAALKFIDINLAQATWPFILSILVWLPQATRLLSGMDPLPVFNLGRISSLIFQLSGVFLALMVLITAFFAFRGAHGVPLWKKILYPLEWLLLFPISSILLGGAPAIHAQFMLAFNKPLVYVPMEKLRAGRTDTPP